MALLRINLHQILIFKSLQADGVTMSDQESFSYKIHIIIVVSLKNDKLYIFEKPFTMPFQICKNFCKILINLIFNQEKLKMCKFPLTGCLQKNCNFFRKTCAIRFLGLHISGWKKFLHYQFLMLFRSKKNILTEIYFCLFKSPAFF